jgi:putative ABC transport system permease protein
VAQSVAAKLVSPGALEEFKQKLLGDPRMTAMVESEVEYYRKMSEMLTTLDPRAGRAGGGDHGRRRGAGRLNTMYSAVAERTREIATLRALGSRRSR